MRELTGRGHRQELLCGDPPAGSVEACKGKVVTATTDVPQAMKFRKRFQGSRVACRDQSRDGRDTVVLSSVLPP